MTEQKPKRGRPRGQGKGKKYTIMKHYLLDQETADKLASLAEEYGLSESAVIRQLIAQYQKGD